MRLLVCAATAFEIDAFAPRPGCVRRVTGVGIPATFAGLVLAAPLPDLILNIGIAGAYPDTGLAIGDVAAGLDDLYGDIGFELPEPPGFRPIAESAFGAFYAAPFPLVQPAFVVRGAPARRGCTVNACTGTRATGLYRRDRFGASFETMEGAAVAQIGQAAGVPVCALRAISNCAADREMHPENIARALESLRNHLDAVQVQSGHEPAAPGHLALP